VTGGQVEDKTEVEKNKLDLTVGKPNRRDFRDAGKYKTKKIRKHRRRNKTSNKTKKSKAGKKDRKQKSAGKKTSRGKAKKVKISRRKNKRKQSPKLEKQDKQTCAITTSCMQAAKDALVYEGNQGSNFIKKFIRYKRFNNTIGNKKGKKGNFEDPKKNMEEAVGGSGNVSSISTCSSASSRTDFNSNYNLLSNCSAMVEEACSSSPLDEDLLAGMETCNKEMTALRTANEKCRKITTNAAEQCSCWTDVKSKVTAIKALEPKCMQNIDKLAKDIKKEKGKCTDMFAKCKKAEDKAVRLISECMNFDVQNLNQTKIAEEAGTKEIGF